MYYLIDNPIGRLSTNQEIKDWIDYLKTLDQDNQQVKDAIKDATEYLND